MFRYVNVGCATTKNVCTFSSRIIAHICELHDVLRPTGSFFSRAFSFPFSPFQNPRFLYSTFYINNRWHMSEWTQKCLYICGHEDIHTGNLCVWRCLRTTGWKMHPVFRLIAFLTFTSSHVEQKEGKTKGGEGGSMMRRRWTFKIGNKRSHVWHAFPLIFLRLNNFPK